MNAISACSDAVDRVTRAFMIVALAIIVVLFLLEVFARNIAGHSLTWVEEVSVMYLGTWFVFIGAAHAMKVGMLISFEFLAQRAGPVAARGMFLVSQALILVFLTIIVVFGLRLSIATFAQPSPALQLPVGAAYLGVVAGCAVMILHVLASVAQALSAGART
jgi:TRAP-type C4-dicarboxylate transport system permease small subunit